MAGNITGQIFRLTTFGESHGEAIGGVIDGCPAGLFIDMEKLRLEMLRRRPGVSDSASARQEDDEVKIISGVFEGKSTGTPIAFIIANKDARPEDYEDLKDIYRPSHADYTYQARYGHRDHRGGGRASGRETAARVAGGAIAKMLLERESIRVSAYTSGIGGLEMDKDYDQLDLSSVYDSPMRCPDPDRSGEMENLLEQLKNDNDTTGGIVSCVIKGAAAGLGDPVFDKLQADLAAAMMSIGGAKGFEYGEGFNAARMKGSEMRDDFYLEGKRIRTKTNHAGGILGGISNGEDIYFRVAFKPVSSVMGRTGTIDKEGRSVSYEGSGRHDICLVPRAVPVVEAMAALVIADHLLRFRTARI